MPPPPRIFSHPSLATIASPGKHSPRGLAGLVDQDARMRVSKDKRKETARTLAPHCAVMRD